MKDRQPTRPGRVKLTPENGQAPFFATMEMADEPSEVGTPLNRATLLSNETASAFGLDPDTSTPEQVFNFLLDAKIYKHIARYQLSQDKQTVVFDSGDTVDNAEYVLIFSVPDTGKFQKDDIRVNLEGMAGGNSANGSELKWSAMDSGPLELYRVQGGYVDIGVYSGNIGVMRLRHCGLMGKPVKTGAVVFAQGVTSNYYMWSATNYDFRRFRISDSYHVASVDIYKTSIL